MIGSTISDDLTQGGKKGNVAFGTLTTIAESPAQFGFLYTGSDDGYVYRSENGGGSWDRVSDDSTSEIYGSVESLLLNIKKNGFMSL